MGLSSKQVSSDGLDWTQNLLLQNGGLELPKPPQVRQHQQQQQQQQSSPLPCPRCDSTNTKFCYYNNYNRSQPRHFCKACRRHWTKGGTLRNVPVGGGRKNKRLKTTKTDQSNSDNTNIAVIQHHHHQHQHQQLEQLPLEFAGQKNISNVLYRALLHPPPQSSPIPNYITTTTTTTATNNSNSGSSFAGSLLRPLPPMPQFPTFTTMGSYDNDPCSSSFADQSQFYSSYAGSAHEDSLYDNGNETQLPFSSQLMTMTTTASMSPWQIPIPTTSTTTSFPDLGHWNWDDLSLLVSPDSTPPPPPEDSQLSLCKEFR